MRPYELHVKSLIEIYVTGYIYHYFISCKLKIITKMQILQLHQIALDLLKPCQITCLTIAKSITHKKWKKRKQEMS